MCKCDGICGELGKVLSIAMAPDTPPSSKILARVTNRLLDKYGLPSTHGEVCVGTIRELIIKYSEYNLSCIRIRCIYSN